jgi:spore coat protein CotH
MTRWTSALTVFAVALAACAPERPDGWTEATHGEVTPNYGHLFDEPTVHELLITVEPDDYERTMEDLDAKLSRGGPVTNLQVEDSIWVPVTVALDGVAWWHVGMRYKGNSSLTSAWKSGVRKLAFRLDFEQYEDDYPEVRNQRFYGFREMTFSNGFKDTSLIRDKVAADIFRDGGVAAARGNFAAVHVDYGEGPVYFGLYAMIEDPADKMMASQFGDGSGNLYKPEDDGADWTSFVQSGFPKKSNEDSGYGDVRAAIVALHSDRTDATAWRASLERVFAVRSFLRLLAINQAMVNWDSYGCMPHNYYLYANPSDGHRLTWIPWDLNESLLLEARSGCDSQTVFFEETGEEWPVIRYLLDDAEYAAFYRNELESALGGAFAVERVAQRIEEAHELIAPYVVGPLAVEAEPYTFLRNQEEFEQSLRGGDDALLDHVEARHEEVSEALAQ